MHDVPRVDRSGEELLRVWATWTPSPPHLVLAEDQDVLRSLYDDESAVVTFDGWKETYRDEQFGALGDRRLHLSLIPQPFFGDLARASIFVLLLNPGVGPHDYYGEFEVPAFRDALLANLRQEFPPGSVPFVFLDPQFSWHGGYDWWHGKLARVIARLAHENDMPFAAARRFVAERLACIELLPYHSASFGIGDRWIQDLPSVRLACAYVRGVVVPRVRRGEAIVVVARKANVWDVRPVPGVVHYGGPEARAAHLTPGSRGGDAILNRLRWELAEAPQASLHPAGKA